MLDMLASGDSQAIMDRFNGQHQVTYGYQLTGRAVQIVNLRVTAIGMMPALPWPRPGARLPAQPLATRRVLLPGCEQRERSEEHTSELQSLMRISYAVFCLKKKNKKQHIQHTSTKII